ncbi:MAG: ATP-binding protein [Motiliproteus sp.]|nr:ATP-binding protein [Motiliproteus sp.]MCW9051337.1 ATP-binding protein [Motiliproteus sp.]
MRRLYWKIFFAFWLVMILIISTNLAVTWFQYQHFKDSEQEQEHISELAFQAANLFEQKGSPGLVKWQDKLKRRTELKVALLDENNIPVTRQLLPPRFKKLFDRRQRPKYRDHDHEDDNDEYWESKKRDGRHGFFRDRKERPLIWPINSASGNRYHFVIFNPHELVDHLYSGSTILWRIGISIAIVALFAMLLSHYLVRPVRLLQRASRKLADGDLDSRVSAAIGSRRDELGELGQDFDTMAHRIQQLIEGQQQMLRDVSHDLRTPLARLRIALELARKRHGEATELDRMELEAERINQMIDEILNLVRLDLRPDGLHRQLTDLIALLQPLVEDANFEQTRVTLNGPTQLSCSIDAKLIYRAVENIVSNALKYSDGEIQLLLQQHPQQLELKVLDQGPGVAEEKLDRLFEPFYRVDEARQRESGGYGLGLAIAAKVIGLHGGQISARNRASGGLEVNIQLPL